MDDFNCRRHDRIDFGGGFVWILRVIFFQPIKNKALQQKRLNEDLEPSGFAYERNEYSLRDNIVKLHYRTPYSTQPLADLPLQKGLVQKVNQKNCRLYRLVTKPYRDTMDKLEYLKAGAPEVYEFFKNLCMRGDVMKPLGDYCPPYPPKPFCEEEE